MNILVSRCLLGELCRYDGASKPVEEIRKLEKEGYTLIPVCPEAEGGLPTPRPPAEIQKDGRVVNCLGADVTQQYQTGARRALELARIYGCTMAILKEKSPSCGNGQIYDGSFTGTLIPGQGVTAELLTQNGIRVFGESNFSGCLDAEGENKNSMNR